MNRDTRVREERAHEGRASLNQTDVGATDTVLQLYHKNRGWV